MKNRNTCKKIGIVLLLASTLITSVPTSPIYANVGTESAKHEPDLTPLENIDLPTQDPVASDSGEVLSVEYPLLDLNLPGVNPSAGTKKKVHLKSFSKKNYSTNEFVTTSVENLEGSNVTITVFDPEGKEVFIETSQSDQNGKKVVTLIPPTNLRPGRYTLTVTDNSGQTSSQNFYWGVLAINTNKASYLPGETGKITIAVLDNFGAMVCDADLTLKITSPDGNSQILTSSEGYIIVNSSICNAKEVTTIPDYETSYAFSQIGTYTFDLTAITENGTQSIVDSVRVEPSLSFEVERIEATRIYPVNGYPVHIKIKANQDFSGLITEIVPDEFEVTKLSEEGIMEYDDVAKDSEKTVENDNVLGAFVNLSLPFLGDYSLTQSFGGRHPDPLIQLKYETYGVVGHDGADFAMPVGTPITTVDDGTVVYASTSGDYGTTLIIQHSWGKSYYGHLSEILVKSGDIVQKGTIVALSGNTGLSTGPHLHFGIKFDINSNTNGYYGKIDPLPYLGLAPREGVLGISTEKEEQVKTIAWNVDIKAGEEITLGYRYDAPDVSPQFYTTGPLRFRDSNSNLIFKEARRWQIASDATTTGEVNPNADNGAQGWTCTAGTDGNCTTGHYTVVDDGSGSPSTSGYISLGTGGTTGETDAWDTDAFTPAGPIISVTSVTVYIYDQSATNALGGTMDTISLSVYMGGGYQTNQDVTPAFNSWGWQSATFNGSWTESDLNSLRIRVIRNRLGSGAPSGQDDDLQIATAYAVVTYTYASYEKLTLDGYTFENDDEDQSTGDAVDSNTILAGSSFSSGKNLTSVKKGERVTLRMQVRNTGGALGSANNLSLFYDRNDGLFTKVEASTSAMTSSTPGNCTSTDWYCETLPSATYSSSAIDPSGNLWFAYQDGSFNLAVAKYVGNGGDCVSGSFECSIVDDQASNNVGYGIDIVFDKSGNPWISYGDTTADSLKVASFVGGGAGAGCGSGSSDWICETVDDLTDQLAQNATKISINPASGKAWVVYDNWTNSSVQVAEYVGDMSGMGCSNFNWNCQTVQDTSDSLGGTFDITFDSSASARIVYRNDTKSAVELAEYIGSSNGTCSNIGWACNVVHDASDAYGAGLAMGLNNSGNPILSYYNTTTDALVLAEYVGSGGDCTWGAYECTTIEGMANLNTGYTSVARAPDGNVWIAYRDMDDTSLSLARYVGGGSGTGCDDTNWKCTTIDSSASYGDNVFMSFDTSGNALVTYTLALSSTSRYARLMRGGEIFPTAGLSANSGDSLSASHSDMTSSSDSSNKSDADCITATTWNNGKWFEGEEGTGLSIPTGSSTSQCTEVAFTIDTSKAVEGRTYRFTLASDNTFGNESTFWRGLNSYATSTLPTITIESSNTRRYSKDANPIFSNCTDTNWGCVTVDATNTLGDFWLALTIDPSGTPWIHYYEDTTSDALHVAKYVGSGGNCDNTGGSDAWQCTTVDSSAAIIGANGSITSDKYGRIWVSYRDSTNGDLKVAVNYDHPDMSACTASGWDCEIVDGTAASVGFESAINIDPGGNPWVTYRDGTNTDLRYARYVGTGGNCTSARWNCGDIDNAGGEDTSITFDDNGKAWVSYFSTGATEFKVAEYVGTGGNCSGGGSWNCVVVDTINANVGNYTGIVIDKLGIPWAVYHDNTSDGLKVATRQNHAGMSACSAAGWDCTEIDTLPSAGADPSIAFDEKNDPLIVYYTDTTMRWAKYVGGGTGNCTDTNWQCTTLDSSAADVGEYSHNGLKFDHSGIPWTVYKDVTNANVKVAKLHMPNYVSDFRYMLDSGKAPATDADGTCNSTTDNKGYCGVYAQDSNYDSITAGANERPMYMFAERFATNSTQPTGLWQGRSNIAPTSETLTLQVYRFGSTNAWENLDTDSASSDCSTADCELTGTAGGTASEYYKADGSNYWVYYRVYQMENTSSITLKTGCFDGGNGDCTGAGAETASLSQLLRHGQWFNSSGVEQPFTF